jgi:peroxiredoxin
MRDNLNYYTDLNAVVLGISVDSVFSLGKFKEEQNYNFSLLSDFNKEVSKAYDAIYDSWILNMNGVSKRAAFVIDSNGLVQYAEVLESAGDLPNFEAIKACVAQIA